MQFLFQYTDCTCMDVLMYDFKSGLRYSPGHLSQSDVHLFQDYRTIHENLGEDHSARLDKIHGSFCCDFPSLLWGFIFISPFIQSKPRIKVHLVILFFSYPFLFELNQSYSAERKILKTLVQFRRNTMQLPLRIIQSTRHAYIQKCCLRCFKSILYNQWLWRCIVERCYCSL